MIARVLFVDDDAQMRHSTAQALRLAGFQVEALTGGEEALALAGPGFAGVVVSDIRMPGMDGMTLLERLHEVDPEIPVILVTGHAEVSLAVEAIRKGAYDFIEKPFVMQELATVIRRAIDHRALVLENRQLRAVAGKRDDVEARLPGRTQVMVDLRYRLRAIGASDADALIIGPTGAGKEVVARALHDISARAGLPFIAINCAALPQALIESELFGHEAGAFPGALRPRYGKFEHARGGTVLLDEIGSMPPDLQAKLLRVLQERVITRLGSNDPVPLDVRFIATSKVDLAELVARGEFREDLFWRLNVAVRELRNLAERTVLGLEETDPEADPGGAGTGRLPDRVAAFERSLIAGAIAAHGGRLRAVYESLGISRKTLYEKMQKYGLDRRLIVEPAEDRDA